MKPIKGRIFQLPIIELEVSHKIKWVPGLAEHIGIRFWEARGFNVRLLGPNTFNGRFRTFFKGDSAWSINTPLPASACEELGLVSSGFTEKYCQEQKNIRIAGTRSSGVPDLLVYRDKEVFFCEVKSPADSLRFNQIDFFSEGFPVVILWLR